MSDRAYEAGHHWVSPFDFEPAVQEGFAFPRPLTIHDSTLRKILLTTGLRPTVDNLLHVAEALEEVGIREIILNVHWWGDSQPERLEFEVCRAVLARGFAFRTTVQADALQVYATGATEGIRRVIDSLRAIGATVMEPQVADPRDESARARQLQGLAEVIPYAQSQGISCALAAVDAGRVDFEYLVRAANEAIRLGVIRIDLLDSFSSLSPEGMKLFISRFRSRLAADVPVTMHIHNDFGLGAAASIAAASAGAHPDVAVNGLSYRSGHPALEEVAVALELLYGVPTGLRLDKLQWLSQVVAERSGLPLPWLKPITGPQAFLRDLPPWMAPVFERGSEVFPPPASCFAPSMVGQRMGVMWGHHLSNGLVRAKLRQMGLGATEEQVAEIRRRIDAGLEAKDAFPYCLSDEEAEGICRAVLGQ